MPQLTQKQQGSVPLRMKSAPGAKTILQATGSPCWAEGASNACVAAALLRPAADDTGQRAHLLQDVDASLRVRRALPRCLIEHRLDLIGPPPTTSRSASDVTRSRPLRTSSYAFSMLCVKAATSSKPNIDPEPLIVCQARKALPTRSSLSGSHSARAASTPARAGSRALPLGMPACTCPP